VNNNVWSKVANWIKEKFLINFIIYITNLKLLKDANKLVLVVVKLVKNIFIYMGQNKDCEFRFKSQSLPIQFTFLKIENF